MHEASADQFAHRPLPGVLGIASLRVGMEDKNQLIHRKPSWVFIEEKRQDGALRSLICACG
jgi:hypothetical protein